MMYTLYYHAFLKPDRSGDLHQEEVDLSSLRGSVHYVIPFSCGRVRIGIPGWRTKRLKVPLFWRLSHRVDTDFGESLRAFGRCRSHGRSGDFGMRIAQKMKDRQPQWEELEKLCDAMELGGKTNRAVGGQYSGAEGIARFASLYRSACTYLALADAYQLPPATVAYLHRLVASP